MASVRHPQSLAIKPERVIEVAQKHAFGLLGPPCLPMAPQRHVTQLAEASGTRHPVAFRHQFQAPAVPSLGFSQIAEVYIGVAQIERRHCGSRTVADPLR